MDRWATSLGFAVVSGLAVLLWHRLTARPRVRWLLWGALGWAGSVAVKTAVALVTNKPLLAALKSAVAHLGYVVLGAAWIGLLTGLTEVLLGYGLARLLRYRHFDEGVGFGLGFGVVEALVLGVGQAAVVAVVAAGLGPPELEKAVSGLTWTTATVASAERALTMVIHLACGVMIVRSLAERRQRWLWGAFGFKSAVDAVAGAYHLTGATKSWPLWLLEVPIAALALLALVLVRVARRGWPAGAGCSSDSL